jgi:pimeloyl-ACP methyl ester carboxylesterase
MILREQRFHTGIVELSFVEGPPRGSPIVVLHGGSTSWQYGQSLIEQLLPHWHVYAPDLRGHGQSGRVPGRYYVSDYVVDIAAFLERVVGVPSIVYGHSLGGETAVVVAAEHPDLVRALIVGDAPLSAVDHATEEPTHKAMNVLWHSLAGKPIAEIVPALKAMPVMASGQETPRRAVDVFGEKSPWFAFQARNLHHLDPGVLAAVLEGPEHMLAGYDPYRLLPAIRCPVLLLQADPQAGGLLRDEEVQMALRLLADSVHVHLPGIGHELHGRPEQASRVLDAITPFLLDV